MKFKKNELEAFYLNALKVWKPEISLSSPEFPSPTIGDIVTEFDHSLSTRPVLSPSQELRRLILNTQGYSYFDIDKNINVTNGNQEANLISTMLSVEPGDEVIIQVPTWPQVQYLAEGFGAKVVPFELQFEDNWAPNFERLKSLVTSKTRLIVISYPSNPTGYVLNKKELETYSNIAEDAHARLLNDETYKFLEWDGSVSPSACEISDEAITTGTLSKTFAAVGVRIGWIVSRDETFIQRSKDLHFYTTLQNNNLGEYIGTRLLERWNELLPRNKELGKHNLDILSLWMKEHEKWMRWVKPKGSTVCFPRFNVQLTSTEFCEELLKKQKALSAPGRTFWPTYDEHIRLGFSKNTKAFVNGLERLSAYLNSFED